ncbi:MAG TPA: ATP-binding cassette domain-containing protein [Blastocatellia bacterium]|jgi:phospholipid/cholesterol/gamma-HCH transport system ATP-binding protein|nr:ATP-binding cassette domain-containing protein [Blastocatellia bacterium]
MSQHAESAIEFENVTMAYGDRKILDDVSFSVNPGETKIVMGGSGTGKSTILKLVLGLIKPQSGRILVDGDDIAQMDERELTEERKKIGMVFQEGALFDSLSVYENVGFRLFEQEVPEREIEEAVLRMLRFVNLEHTINMMPAELSGGMRRRVGIARALVGSPQLILFDEPTAGLDPPTARTILELAIKLRDLEGVSSIFVTHRLEDIKQLSTNYATINEDGEIVFQSEDSRLCLVNTQFIMLKDGKVSFSGTDEQLWESDDPYLKDFFRA